MDLASALVVTRNNKQTIEQCLASIFNQSYENVEIVIIDSSDDGTSSIIASSIKNKNKNNFIVKHLHSLPAGVGNARNLAVKTSSGKYLFFVDADFSIDKEYIKQAVDIFSQDSKIVSISFCKEFSHAAKGLFPAAIYLFDKARKPVGPDGQCDYWICQRKVFDLVGYFMEDLEAAEDIEWAARAKRILKMLSKKEGYKVAIAPHIATYENKQCWSIGQYWRKLRWYGTAFGNLNYIKETRRITFFEVFFMLSQISLPFLITYAIWANFPIYLCFFLISMFFLPSLFITYRAIRRGLVTRSVFLIPFLILYKSFFLLTGAFSKVLENLTGG